MAIDFKDDFVRSNSATVGNGWSEDESGGTASIDTNRCKLVDTGGTCGIYRSDLDDISPNYLRIDLNASGNDIIMECKRGAGTGAYVFMVYIDLSSTNLDSYNGVSYDTLKNDIVSGTTYKVEFKNINWTNHTYDAWIDDVEIGTGYSFPSENDFDFVRIDTQTSGTGTHYCNWIQFGAADAGTDMQINIGDSWKAIEGAQINIGDDWKVIEGMQINIGDDWKTIF